MSKSVVVTGAAGFIGSHACEAFLARGDRVIGLDNLNDYYPPARKRANLAEIRRRWPQEDRFRFVQGDVRDRALVDRLFAEDDVGAVVHLAAMAGVRASVADPELYYAVNVTGTLHLLEAARRRRTGVVVFASTSSVYGNASRRPFVETDPCDRPLAPYAASKRAAELLGHTYHHLHGLDFTALRFFTVYGPRGRPDMMAYRVLESITTGKPAPLYNNGQMHRDWTYVDDIVRGIVAAAGRPLGYEVINVGRGQPILLAEFVRQIEEQTGRKAHLTPAPMPDSDAPYTYADTGKAQRLLDYRPQVSVAEGVERLCRWFQEVVLPETDAGARGPAALGDFDGRGRKTRQNQPDRE